jgi:hypothetical protein
MASVTYKGNGSDGGSVPTDPNNYAAGATVSVLPAGSMTKTGATFAYWNTKADGSGTFHGWPQDTSFPMPATNVTLYAQWFVTTGLPNGGKTTHYAFSYDSTLAAGGLEPTRTIALMNSAEADYALISNPTTGWFAGVTPTGAAQRSVYVTRLNGGANNTGDIRLKPNTNNVSELRCYLISEITESFMQGQNKGWGFLPGAGATNENSCGEALSLFLTQQFALLQGFANPYSGFTANTSNGWLNSSLPAANANSTRYTYNADGSIQTDFGSRLDYVNSTLPYPGNGPGTGCSMLFIHYLFHQLGFSIQQIIDNAPGYDSNGALNATAPLRGVYKNLTGDNSDPFPYFKQLLDTAFPPDQISSIPGTNPDDPYPLGSLTFVGGKNFFGSDEINDAIAVSGGVLQEGAFGLALDGFSRNMVGGGGRPSDPAVAFGGTSTFWTKTVYQSSNVLIPQRIHFWFGVKFDAAKLGAFPASGETPAAVTTSINVLGQNFPANSEFFFLAGSDPYFTNVRQDPSDPNTENVPWLSEDLRVFTATPGLVPVPVPGGPTFNVGTNAIQGAYQYIQDLIAYLNKTYGDPTKTDPFDPNQHVLPGQFDAYTGDSSVRPTTSSNEDTFDNYNFAIARVRLRGPIGGKSENVKVFFRLWQTQTADTYWQPGYTYLSNDATGLNPKWPVAPPDNHTIPFFATGNAPNFSDPNNPEYGKTGVSNTGVNNQTILINQGDRQWAYFGCFLNLYDPGFSVNGQSVRDSFAKGDHHCLVAQIAYAGTPIKNVNGVTMSPENCDKLAQRNLQVTVSDNPGSAATHRIPQTFDIRPSVPVAAKLGLLSHPDELMIEWGNTPVGSIANIYWPQVNATGVLALASRLYSTQMLSAADNNTIQCTTTDGVTYVPIPFGTGDSLAGLFTVDLPPTVVKGQEFNVTVRRISTRQIKIFAPPEPPKLRAGPASTKRAAAAAGNRAAVAATREDLKTERYVVGSFQVKIPVKTRKVVLPGEETTLAIFKARLAAMSPANRWYPVFVRYIGLLAQRVDGLGGDANSIVPSFAGVPVKRKGHGERRLKYTGKIVGLIFDRFGDFEGFLLDTMEGEHNFFSREREMEALAERAWHERLRISVCAECDDPHRPLSIIVREPPAPFLR